MSRSFTREQFDTWWRGLTPSQQEWARGKAGWEHITLGAVMLSYDVPPPEHLNDNGTARRCEKCSPDRAAWDHGEAAA